MAGLTADKIKIRMDRINRIHKINTNKKSNTTILFLI